MSHHSPFLSLGTERDSFFGNVRASSTSAVTTSIAITYLQLLLSDGFAFRPEAAKGSDASAHQKVTSRDPRIRHQQPQDASPESASSPKGIRELVGMGCAEGGRSGPKASSPAAEGRPPCGESSRDRVLLPPLPGTAQPLLPPFSAAPRHRSRRESSADLRLRGRGSDELLRPWQLGASADAEQRGALRVSPISMCRARVAARGVPSAAAADGGDDDVVLAGGIPAAGVDHVPVADGGGNGAPAVGAPSPPPDSHHTAADAPVAGAAAVAAAGVDHVLVADGGSSAAAVHDDPPPEHHQCVAPVAPVAGVDHVLVVADGDCSGGAAADDDPPEDHQHVAALLPVMVLMLLLLLLLTALLRRGLQQKRGRVPRGHQRRQYLQEGPARPRCRL